jgi:hypothetical protein
MGEGGTLRPAVLAKITAMGTREKDRTVPVADQRKVGVVEQPSKARIIKGGRYPARQVPAFLSDTSRDLLANCHHS